MYLSLQKFLARLSYLCVISVVLTYLQKERLPDYTQVLPELRVQPIQRTTTAPPFVIDYKGNSYQVQPRATYDLKGLVVSQNNPTGITDIYHDSTWIMH